MMDLYSDRLKGPRARTEQDISGRVEKAFYSLICAYEERDFFGMNYPQTCPDNGRPYSTDSEALENARSGMVTGLTEWRQKLRTQFSDTPTLTALEILDSLEWHAHNAGESRELDFHQYFSHHHKTWDKDAGLAQFRSEVNRIFARNGLAYEMEPDGLIIRVVQGPVAEELRNTRFDSGDAKTDELLELARTRFFDRDPDAGQRSLEALWDAFERLKTHKDPKNKKTSAEALLQAATTDEAERDLLRQEMRDLTGIGNQWRIRHHETDKRELGADRRLRDYFFLRMFALLHRIIPGRRVSS